MLLFVRYQALTSTREVLLKMIKERKTMFDNMIFQLYELLEEINISEKRKEFKILCREKKIKSKSTEMKRIGNIYALNIIMKNLRDLFGNRPCFRDVSYLVSRNLEIMIKMLLNIMI